MSTYLLPSGFAVSRRSFGSAPDRPPRGYSFRRIWLTNPPSSELSVFSTDGTSTDTPGTPFGHRHPNCRPVKLFDAACADRDWENRGVRFYTGVPAPRHDEIKPSASVPGAHTETERTSHADSTRPADPQGSSNASSSQDMTRSSSSLLCSRKFPSSFFPLRVRLT